MEIDVFNVSCQYLINNRQFCFDHMERWKRHITGATGFQWEKERKKEKGVDRSV